MQHFQFQRDSAEEMLLIMVRQIFLYDEKLIKAPTVNILRGFRKNFYLYQGDSGLVLGSSGVRLDTQAVVDCTQTFLVKDVE